MIFGKTSFENPPAFFRDMHQWLSTLPDNFLLDSITSSRGSYFRIEQKNGQELILFPKIILGLQPDESEGFIVKTQKSEEEKLVVLWEDLWCSKQKIVQSRLKALLGISERIPARLSQVRRLDRPTTLHFLQKNHLQDAVISKYKYGLYLPQKHFRVLENPPKTQELLVAVATFARPRVFERAGEPHRSYELVRFANLLNTTVVGGLDKLLSHFAKEHQPDDLMTYADLEWSSGHSYQNLGFRPQGDTPPQEFWVDPVTMERYSPNRLPNGITGENAREHGFVKIKNAGSRKFVKNFHPQTPSP